MMRELRTLLIDDDRQFLDVSQRVLSQRFGWPCDTASSGLEGIKVLEEATAFPDVVVIDLSMPGMSGQEVVRVLRDRWSHLCIVVLTGSDRFRHPQAAIEAIDEGADDYLTKPTKYGPLALRLQLAYQRRQREEARLQLTMYASDTDPDIIRLQHLTDNIHEDLSLLKDFEDALRAESHPRRQREYRREIEDMRRSVAGNQQEYDELRTKISGTFPGRLQGVDAQLRMMEGRLDALVGGETAIQGDQTDSRREIAVAEMKTQRFQTRVGGSKATIALVFTDVVGSTALGNELGDEAMGDVRRAHFERATGLIADCDGYEIKTIGDSFMAAFRTSVDALDFALDLQDDTGHEQVAIRAGIHVGPVEIEDEDAFGGMVNYASRVEGMGEGAEIWISDRAKSDIDAEKAERHRSLLWTEHSDCELKGFEGKHTLWSVVRSD